jgi:phosphatidyl-myo-inositol dimannoside synthase
MKSLLISGTNFPPRTGGIAHLMEGIVSALGSDSVCCLTGQPVAAASAGKVSNGPRVYRRPAAFRAGFKLIRAAAWGAAIAEIMLRERPKIVQIATASEGAMALWLRRRLRLPYVVYAHGNEVLQGLQGQGEDMRAALQQADRVLAVSRFTGELLQRSGVSADRIEIVHPGCDSERFRPLQPRPELRQTLLGERCNDRVILTVGNLVARKGHDMVIRSLPRIRESVPDVTYLIVGRGRYRSELERLASSLGVRDRVIFADRVPAELLPEVYALGDVFAMPSREQAGACDAEGFGLVFLEASACAKPVVGGRSGGIPDAVADGETGLLVDPHDAEELAASLARLLADGELAARLGRQGRARVVRDFGWQRAASRVKEILQEVLRRDFAPPLHDSACSGR